MSAFLSNVPLKLSLLLNFLHNLIKFTDSTLSCLAGSVLKRIADWLSGIVGRCNETMGTPYKKCKAAFNYAEGECK